MKKNRAIQLIIVLIITIVYLCGAISVFAEGLLPSLSETVGVAMPSLGEALQRYPDNETENDDGSITELYINVSETDFNTFSVYLEEHGAELADYHVEDGILTAEIMAKGSSFNLSYDSKNGEAEVIYPSGFFDEWVKNAKTHFNAAKKLLEEGQTDAAYAEIFSVPEFFAYKETDSLMKEDADFAAAVAAKVARKEKQASFKQVGNIVTFGTYPQTTKGTDQTPIEWIVLDYDEANHKALLLSKYGLDVEPYNTDQANITWEKCTLRVWLNRDFLKKAFNSTEQSAILTTDVDNSSGQGYSEWNIDGGNNTQDKIFLLSYAEANRFFNVTFEDTNNIGARVAPTAYAIAQGARTSKDELTADGEPAGMWWLRSPGHRRDCSSSVYDGGSLAGTFVNSLREYYSHYELVDRPALWVDLESDIFRSAIYKKNQRWLMCERITEFLTTL